VISPSEVLPFLVIKRTEPTMRRLFEDQNRFGQPFINPSSDCHKQPSRASNAIATILESGRIKRTDDSCAIY
jgi:hypothetical protein